MAVEDSNLRVPVELEHAGTDVRTKARLIVAQLETLAKQLLPLQETWNDPGFGAFSWFQGLQQEWNMSAKGLFGDGAVEPGILGAIANRLDVSWYNYVTTQTTNTKQWMQH